MSTEVRGATIGTMQDGLFRDRRDAGRVLAAQLQQYRGRDDVLVLALPRGGVPVAYEVATALGAPLDVFLVRKLGVPGREELAMGAIASNGVLVLNDDVVRALRIRPDEIRRVADMEGRELTRRERLYRGDRPLPDVAGKIVILVDDGLATGSSMRAAVQALRKLKPARIVIAVPAASSSTCKDLAAEVDEVVCATTPSPFYAVGQSYWDFSQTTDEEVIELLHRAWKSRLGRDSPKPSTEVGTIRSDVATVDLAEKEPLLHAAADAHFVLLGEASHGTHEFYSERARMTRWLIEEKGFNAVAVEADWPDAYRVNRYVRGQSEDATAEESLRGFQRFPTWMWRNAVVLDFVGWLKEHNDRVGGDGRTKVGFYGLDLYSLYRSIQEVISYLERVDPEAAARARSRYSCFDHFGDDEQAYGYQAAFGAGETCEREVIDQLVDFHSHAVEYAERDGLLAEDDLFYAQQNARTVKAAEEYYRSMFRGRVSSWNLRDRHMTDTLDELAGHLSRQLGGQAKIVVWAHNSHLGDARATELGTLGELNVGQLTRERHRGDCLLLGFTTYEGTVTAANDWGAPAERKQVRAALPGSYEELFHEVGLEAFFIDLQGSTGAAEVLRSPRLERAIGVIYKPETERQSHYFRGRLADQFDVVLHIDDSRAVEPLERTAGWERGEVPETYPHAV